MHDDLVKRLRAAAIMSEALSVFLPHSEGSAVSKLYNEAADAIEELLSKLNHDDAQIQSLVEAAEERRWIPVTERLPEQYVNVLVFLHSLDWNSIYYSIDHLMEDGQWWKASTSWKHEVTHWMPLPEPPKEGA